MNGAVVLDGGRHDLGSHVRQTGGKDVACNRAGRAHRQAGDGVNDLAVRHQGVSCRGRLLESGDGEGSQAARVDRGIQTGWWLQGVSQTDGILRENAAIDGQEPDALRVVPTAFVQQIGVVEDILVRGREAFFLSRSFLVEHLCLVDGQLKAAEQAYKQAALGGKILPDRRQFVEITVQFPRQHGLDIGKGLIHQGPWVRILACLLLQRMGDKDSTGKAEGRQHSAKTGERTADLP